MDLLKEIVREFQEDDAANRAAALAYYTVFSLAPLLLIVIGVAGIFMGEASAREQIMEQVRSMMGAEGSRAIAQMLENAELQKQGAWATAVGLVLLLVGASGVFAQLQASLNHIWDVKPAPDRGFLGTVKDRFLSMTMVVGIGFLLMVSLVLSAAVASMTEWLQGLAPGTQALAHVAEWVFNVAVFTGLFGLLYRVLPDVDIEWRDVWVGAAVTSVLFNLGRMLIGLYLAHSSTASAFGAAGSLAVVLVWVYYSSMLLFFGAEFTQVYARHRGSMLSPSRGAVGLGRKVDRTVTARPVPATRVVVPRPQRA